MGTRTERARQAQRQVERGPMPLRKGTEGRLAGDGPSAWRWSRGADVLALLFVIALVTAGGAVWKAGSHVLGGLLLAAAGLAVVGLVVHAATAGRRYGGPGA